MSLTLSPSRMLGTLEAEPGAAPLAGAAWYTAHATQDGLAYSFTAGALLSARYLTADLLVDGEDMVVFALTLQEGEDGPRFALILSTLSQCQARLRMELAAVSQNRWRYEREGAWLKPMAALERVDLAKVDRMGVLVLRKGERPARFCLTPVTATAEEPARLTDPVLPRGPLLDELGQSAIREWPGKSRSAEEVTDRLRQQLAAAPAQAWPEDYSRWGGWSPRGIEGTGFFRTHHDGRRWWLLDPDGHIFWSAGVDCVRVDTEAAYAGLEPALAWLPDPSGPYAPAYSAKETEQPAVNYLAANLIRAFGEGWYEFWSEIALAELRRLGFNTVANWSDWAQAAEEGFPYVRPLSLHCTRTPMVYRDFPDVFDPSFAEDAADYALQLRETANDPALIGYFLMNEPTWAFSEETPAAGMLFNTPTCACRRALSDWLREQHGSDAGLAAAWGVDVTLAAVAKGPWTARLSEAAQADLAEFSGIMATRLFGGLTAACREVDPNHLNLGARYYTLPPRWALDAMRSFDAFSMNCYKEHIPAPELAELSTRLGLPVLIGEWHFGALDVGLPGSGIGQVRDQAARGAAFRLYTEHAAAQPFCIGVHYFTLYDQSALGRFDGECYNIGFLDVCHRSYEPLAAAARASHERLYQVALGEVQPFSDAPEYLEPLYL